MVQDQSRAGSIGLTGVAIVVLSGVLSFCYTPRRTVLRVRRTFCVVGQEWLFADKPSGYLRDVAALPA